MDGEEQVAERLRGGAERGGGWGVLRREESRHGEVCGLCEAAVPSVLEEKVECVDPGPNFSGEIKSSRAQIPEIGFSPLVRALPKTRMSG